MPAFRLTEDAQPEAAAAASSWKGELLHIHVAPVASSEMAALDAAMLVAGYAMFLRPLPFKERRLVDCGTKP